MTATARRYRAPYVSEMLAEPDRSYDDCAASVAVMLYADWTLGEWLVEPDGDDRRVLVLRNTVRKRIGDTDGGLTFHDVNDIGHELDPDIADLPRYPGQKAKPGQSTRGADLRLTFEAWREMVRNGHSSGICGYLPGSTVGHVIHVTDGDADDALVKDPLTRNPPGWKGDRRPWSWLRDFTERKVGGDRYGTTDAIAVAVVKVGDQTEAMRQQRADDRVIANKDRVIRDTRQERDAAQVDARNATAAADELRTRLTAAEARITELENTAPADCTAAVNGVLDSASDGIDAVLAGLRR